MYLSLQDPTIYLHLFNKYLAPSNEGQKFHLQSADILVK